MKDKIKEELKVQPLTEEEKASKHILKRLVGPIASCKESTRNGRHYSRELWENALNDDVFKEKVANKSLFLELGHPADREEIDMQYVCACIPEMPKIIDDDLYATIDVLDTPNGRILSNLIDYGFVPGISSRGSGDVNGEEVDPDTFYLETFDIVNVPAMARARLSVTESLSNKPTLKQALQESLNKATPADKKVMEETLKNLNIDIQDGNNESCENIEKVELKENLSTKKEDVNDIEAPALVKSLQETLQSKLVLEKQLQELQEKLAVSDTKTKKLEEELQKHKASVIRLSKVAQSNKELKDENQSLKEQLVAKNETIIKQSNRISKLAEKLNNNSISSKQLNENLDKANSNNQVLKEQFEVEKKDYENKITKLNEQLIDTKATFDSREKELTSKLSKSVKLIEKYKNYVVSVVDEYIKSKAVMLGINENEIKNRLSESYTIEDINKVCDDLQNYSLRLSKLPFNLTKDTRVKITESKNSQYEPVSPEDDIEALEKFIKG